jgi:hypothetical protein
VLRVGIALNLLAMFLYELLRLVSELLAPLDALLESLLSALNILECFFYRLFAHGAPRPVAQEQKHSILI